jgi:hypothetical protein
MAKASFALAYATRAGARLYTPALMLITSAIPTHDAACEGSIWIVLSTLTIRL